MIKLKNTPLRLLQLNFTGYQFPREKQKEVVAWLEKSLGPGEYYGEYDTIIFLRNAPAELMLRLRFHDVIMKEYTDYRAFKR